MFLTSSNMQDSPSNNNNKKILQAIYLWYAYLLSGNPVSESILFDL